MRSGAPESAYHPIPYQMSHLRLSEGPKWLETPHFALLPNSILPCQVHWNCSFDVWSCSAEMSQIGFFFSFTLWKTFSPLVSGLPLFPAAWEKFLLLYIMKNNNNKRQWLCDSANNNRFRVKASKTHDKESTSHCQWHVGTHMHTQRCGNPVQLIFSIFTQSSCSVQTPFPLNWILAHFQVPCSRHLHLK